MLASRWPTLLADQNASLILTVTPPHFSKGKKHLAHTVMIISLKGTRAFSPAVEFYSHSSRAGIVGFFCQLLQLPKHSSVSGHQGKWPFSPAATDTARNSPSHKINDVTGLRDTFSENCVLEHKMCLADTRQDANRTLPGSLNVINQLCNNSGQGWYFWWQCLEAEQSQIP